MSGIFEKAWKCGIGFKMAFTFLLYLSSNSFIQKLLYSIFFFAFHLTVKWNCWHIHHTFEVNSNNWISGMYSHSWHGKNHKYVSPISLRSIKGKRAQLLMGRSSQRLDLCWAAWLHPLCQAAAVQLAHLLPCISTPAQRLLMWHL